MKDFTLNSDYCNDLRLQSPATQVAAHPCTLDTDENSFPTHSSTHSVNPTRLRQLEENMDRLTVAVKGNV